MIAIRKADSGDIDAVMACFEAARKYMRSYGNLYQWTGGYPSRELIEDDIRKGICFVGENAAGEIVMAFAFIIGDDPTYAVIEDGSWLDDLLYGTIHRLASNGKSRGVLSACVDFCLKYIGNLRVDTHINNTPMLRGLARLGFERCGRIYCIDGTPREAFQLKKYE